MVKENFPHIPYHLFWNPNKRPVDFFIATLPLKEEDFGVNCQLYAAAVTRAFGRFVPDDYRSSEYYFDPKKCLKTIKYPEEKIENGDIFGFRTVGDKNPKNIHLGIAFVTDKQELMIIHASRIAKRVIREKLPEVLNDGKHQEIVFVKRPTILIPGYFNPSALKALGF